MFRLLFSFNRYCSNGAKMKYLNVAEKNDAAKTIAGLLSNGSSARVY
jgi:DNA topoisomerase III